MPLVHIGVGDASGDEDLLKGLEVGEGFLGRLDVRLGDDLHERGAGAVEIDEGGVGEVGGFGDIFLEVDAVEFDDLAGVLDVFLSVLGIVVIVERDAAAEAEGEVHLGDLIVLGHVGVEVVLPVPDDGRRGGAAKEHAGEDGALDGEFVENGKRAGQAEASRAGVGVWLVGKRGFATAKHFGVRFDLAVNFESDGDDVV